MDSASNDISRRLIEGWSASVVGSTVSCVSPDGGQLTVVCDSPDAAAALLASAEGQLGQPMFVAHAAQWQAKQATLAATNKASVLHERNRWLAQTDPFVLPDPSLPADMPADVLAVLAAPGTPSVQDEIATWRQALRDYPAGVTDWTAPPPLPAPPSITLPSGRPLIIVT